MIGIFNKSLLNIFSRPHVWSNLIFLLPFTIAFVRSYYIEGVLLFFMFITSIFYHSLSSEVDAQWVFVRQNVSKIEMLAGFFDYVFANLLGGGLLFDS